eukprot:7362036-Prymnesium_polylepis.1
MLGSSSVSPFVGNFAKEHDRSWPRLADPQHTQTHTQTRVAPPCLLRVPDACHVRVLRPVGP